MNDRSLGDQGRATPAGRRRRQARPPAAVDTSATAGGRRTQRAATPAHDGAIRPEVDSSDMLVLDRDLRAPRRARAWLHRLLAPDVPPALLDDACLVVSELVSNALRHGLGDVVVRCSLDDVRGSIVVSVTDSGDGDPHVLPVDPARVGGVGLTVVDRVAAAWGVAGFPGGKTVWARIGPEPDTASGG